MGGKGVARVTNVKIETDDGLTAQITVRRPEAGSVVVGFSQVGDVPEDVRRALSIWLAGNQT